MSSIEDLVLERSEDVPESMKIVSDVLEPITISDRSARFVLPRAGILSKESVFQFELTSAGGQPFLPAGAGIYSLFESCSLFVGQQRIQHTNQLGIYKSITKSYDTPSYRQNYTRLLNGINNIVMPAPVAVDITTRPGGTNKQAGKLCPPAVSKDSNNPTTQTLPYDLLLTADPNTTPSWSVKIKEIFPLCDKINLPLYLLKEPVSIVFNFNKQSTGADSSGKDGIGSLCCFAFTGVNRAVTNAPANVCTLSKDTCQFFPDYLYYTEERQFLIEEEMNANKGMAKIYTDVISVNSQLPANPNTLGAAVTADLNFTFQIPLSNYSAKNLLLAFTPISFVNKGTNEFLGRDILNYNSMFGKYAMLNSVKPYTIQVRLNDKLEFPQPLISNTLKAQEAEYVYGSPVNLHTGLYSNNGCDSGTGNFETTDANSYFVHSTGTAGEVFSYAGGMNLNKNLTGMQHFFALNVSHLYGDSDEDSVRISQKPIEIFGTYPVNLETNFDSGYNVACFSEITKMFSVKDGLVQIYDYAEKRMGQ